MEALSGSILSFPDRGDDGDARYPGNCSGKVVETLIAQFRPRLVVDPMEGSGTSGDVCRRLGVRYAGSDLKQGVDALRGPAPTLRRRAIDLVFLHPPYHDMILYSGKVWGETPDSRDLSRCVNLGQFEAQMNSLVGAWYRALAPGGRLAILVGDLRRAGRYTPLLPLVLGTLPEGVALEEALEAILIKAQHHCQSDRKGYAGRFIPIRHEYLVVFRKAATPPSAGS